MQKKEKRENKIKILNIYKINKITIVYKTI